MVNIDFEPRSEFKTCGFSIAHAASQFVELTGHVGESSNKQLYSIYLVLFLSWHPSQPL